MNQKISKCRNNAEASRPIAKTMNTVGFMMFVYDGKTEGGLSWSCIYKARLVVKYFGIAVFLLLLL